jgi:catechol 2,3-dioxygenase-like lactoylglutathione lyase family enzyme
VSITRIQHIALPFPGTPEAFAAARGYYSETLRLRGLPVPDELAADVLWFAVGDQELHLFAERDAPSDVESRRHACFQVSDLVAFRKRLTADGMETFDGVPALPGRPRFFARDPFGNVLEFMASSEEGRE